MTWPSLSWKWFYKPDWSSAWWCWLSADLWCCLKGTTLWSGHAYPDSTGLDYTVRYRYVSYVFLTKSINHAIPGLWKRVCIVAPGLWKRIHVVALKQLNRLYYYLQQSEFEVGHTVYWAEFSLGALNHLLTIQPVIPIVQLLFPCSYRYHVTRKGGCNCIGPEVYIMWPESISSIQNRVVDTIYRGIDSLLI